MIQLGSRCKCTLHSIHIIWKWNEAKNEHEFKPHYSLFDHPKVCSRWIQLNEHFSSDIRLLCCRMKQTKSILIEIVCIAIGNDFYVFENWIVF